MPLRLFRSRSFSMANVIGLTFSIGIFGAVFLLSQYLQIVMGYSPFQAGLRTLPWTAAPMIFAPLAGFLAPKVGLRSLLLTGLLLQAGALFWLAALIGPDVTYGSLVPALLMAGIGMGLTFAPSSTAVLVDMDEPDHGTASSTNSTLREIGVALGIAVLTAVFLAAGGALDATRVRRCADTCTARRRLLRVGGRGRGVVRALASQGLSRCAPLLTSGG